MLLLSSCGKINCKSSARANCNSRKENTGSSALLYIPYYDCNKGDCQSSEDESYLN